MAIERMEMMNLIGHMEDVEQILRDMVLAECIQPVPEIQHHHIASTLEDMSLNTTAQQVWAQNLSGKWEHRDAQIRLDLLMDRLGVPREIDKSEFETRYDFKDVENDINIMFDRFAEFLKQIEALESEYERVSRLRVMSILRDVGIDFRDMEAMGKFAYRIGSISKEHRVKLSLNYENISAAVIHIGPWKNQEIYLILYPKALENENIHILRSIDFEEFEMLEDYLGTPAESMAKVEARISEIESGLADLQMELQRFRECFEPTIRDCYNKMRMEETLLQLRGMVTVTRNFFFVSGWIPKREVQKMEALSTAYGDRVILSFGNDRQVAEDHTRPTRLKNHWLVRPFEMLVTTYGTPAYHETDPTWFVAITYMVLFGMMFGDLGQGLLLLVVGFFIAKRVSAVGGGILSRIAISSMAFGFVYDSFFGYEHLISGMTAALFGEGISERIHFYSMENITSILLISIVLGVVLLCLSYGLSIINKLKIGDIQEGIFGKNGLAGLVLYLVLLAAAYGVVTGAALISTGFAMVLVVLLTGLIAVREPLTSLIRNHRPLIHESVGMFSVEAFFETFEVYLGYLSNTLSFVRVGAFALNHIGLFMAFHIIAEMLNSPVGDVAMFVAGNAVVIGLEGMIVMIQGMRLLYYEMFSKYYSGDGTDFKAVTLEA